MAGVVQTAYNQANSASLSVTFTNNITAGNTVVVCVNCISASGQTVAPSSGGDTFTQDTADSSNSGCSIWSVLSSAGGYKTVNLGGGQPAAEAWIYEVSGLTALDQVHSSTASGGSAFSSGATGTTAQASEFVVGIGAGYSGSSGSPTTATGPSTGGWTNLAGQDPEWTANTAYFPGVSGYQMAVSTGTFTYSGTFSRSVVFGSGSVATFKAGPNVHQATATLSGSGSLSPAKGAFGGGAALAGAGTLATPAGNWMVNALSGTGTLTGTGGTGIQVALTGSGTLGLARTVGWQGMAALSGTGLLTPGYIQSVLSGSGTLSVPGFTLHPPPLLMSGTGTLAVLQVLGGLVSASPGASTPYAHPGTSQVAVAPPGTTAWQYLGSIGQVTALTYSFACPGGCDKMTATVMVPAAYRTQLFDPGWQVRITRGGHQVWDGKLDEPVPTSAGWTLTAVGTGNRGTDFLAIYSGTWPSGQPDDAVNEAIARGMPWVNPGIGTPAGAWFGQEVDSGAQTITALLDLVCTRGALTWYVNSQPGGLPGDDLSVFPLPAVPNRLLVCTTPVARTLGADVNTIVIRYQITADTTSGTTSVPATYGITVAQNAQSVAAHDVIETYIDLSDVGPQSAAAAQAVGNSVLAIYQRASWAGPFTGSYGQLLNTGGVPVDPGTDQAGTYVRLILTDYGYGGEVTPQFPVEFLTGAYEWDDFAQVFTVTPYVALDQSLTGMLSMANTVLTPITVAS